MTDPIVIKGITQDDLLALDIQDDNRHIEVDYGQIVFVEHDMGFLHTKIIQILFLYFHAYLQENPIGDVFIDGARYILAQSGESIQRAYKPDFSFIRKGRIPDDFDWQGDFIGAPNLAVEVISRGQSYAHQLSKIGRYLEAGSDEGWLIHPDQQLFYQHKPDGNAFRYGIDDTVTSDLFPNLKIVLRDIFTPAP